MAAHWPRRETRLASQRNRCVSSRPHGFDSRWGRQRNRVLSRFLLSFSWPRCGREALAALRSLAGVATARLVGVAWTTGGPEPFSLRRLQAEQHEWAKRNFGEEVQTYLPLLGVVEEVGELAHAHLKEAQGIRTTEDHEAKAKDAVGDAIIYLADYCSRRGWDLQDIVEQTWAAVKRRDWKANPEGGA